MQQVQTLPPNQQFAEIAKIAGFQDWAAHARPAQAKSTQPA